ncbi:MAG: helix-turn-helix domain-containing protein [Chitinophagaceae bacterium]
MKASELIGRNIKKWREFKGIKQDTLAQKLGITSAALSQIENGKSDISINRVEQIAEALEIDILLLLSNPQQAVNILHSPNSNGIGVQHNNINADLLKILHSELEKKNEHISFLHEMLREKNNRT